MTSDAKKAAKDTAEGLSEKAGAATSSAQQAAADLGASASDFAARAGETASDLYGRAQERARDAADKMPDTAADAVAAGKRAYDKGSKTIGRQVAKQPIEALLLAAAIGYLVGWATTRS